MKAAAQREVVCILGTTGVGKSRLAVKLAQAAEQKLKRSGGAEVINSDAMQVYKALPILTAKVTEPEMQGVPHRLMSFLDPLKDEYVVLDFVKDAKSSIGDLHQQGKLPVVVGGTAYYAQHLIAPPKPAARAPSQDLAAGIANLPTELRELLDILPSLPNSSTVAQYPPGFPVDILPARLQSDAEAFAWSCWNLLNILDSETALRWHWRDIRKVRRQIELSLPHLFQNKTDPAAAAPTSPNSAAEAASAGESDPRSDYRVLLFWIQCQKEVLQNRLDSRVDSMVESGLMDEVQQLYSAQVAAEVDIDYSRGICQAIGYKPFATYLQLASPRPKDFKAAVEQTKIQTRQYAKRQISWFKSKLLPAVQRIQADEPERDVQVFVLDATDVHDFERNVEDNAVELLRKFLAHERMPEPLEVCPSAGELFEPATKDPVSLAKYTCEACTTDPARPVIIEERQRRAHERTKMHQKRLAGKGPRVDQKGQRQQQQQNSESQQLGMNAAEDETR